MKKSLKCIGYVSGGLIALLILLLLASPLWLGQTAGMIANSVVPRITGTDFNVDKIRINLYTGTLRVEKLRLANPEGYAARDAVSVDVFSVDFNTLSALGDTIKVKEVAIENPYISYLSEKGTNNFDAILANVNAGGGHGKDAAAKEETEAGSEGGVKVIIDRLGISGTKVRYEMLTLPVPNIVLTGLGSSSNGITIDSVGVEIWEKIKESLTSTGGAIGGTLKSLGNTGSEGVTKSVDVLTGGAKKSMDTVTDGAKKGVDTVTDSAKKATEAIGNLFK